MIVTLESQGDDPYATQHDKHNTNATHVFEPDHAPGRDITTFRKDVDENFKQIVKNLQE